MRVKPHKERKMPDYNKNIDQVIFSAEESEAGHCPVCGRGLNFGERVDLDDSIKYPWNCECGAEGNEFASKVFDGHYVDASTISEEQLDAYIVGIGASEPSDKVLFRVEHEIPKIHHLAVSCPSCKAWMRGEQASSDHIPDMVVAEFSRYKCTVCGHEFCPAELGDIEAENCGSSDLVYRDCAK